jgi:pre-mRNA-splicing factor CWC26
MSSGHKAGLQHYSDFNKSEIEIQARKNEDAQKMVDKYGMGETVYRDKDGRKADPSDMAKSKKGLGPDELRRLNQGKVQREKLEATAREMEYLRDTTFARHQDDDRLEEMRKNEIRKEDPMAHYAAVKKPKKSQKVIDSGSAELSKPVYKGPPPKPNRFGIRPGYRWDGVDRGNGFEDKVLAQKFSASRKEEQAYRWRSADM